MSVSSKNKSTIYAFPSLLMPKSLLIGNDSIKEIGKVSKKLEGKNVIIFTDRNLAKLRLIENAIQALEKEGISVNLFEDVEFEPTVEVVEKALSTVKEKHYDIIIGFGGGSAIDVAKAVACLARHEGGVRDYFGKDTLKVDGLPSIMAPTTGGTGAEVSPGVIFIDQKDGNKKVIHDRRLIPDVAIVDPLLTLTVPPKLTAYTGIDALCHAMGCYISKKANPLADALAIEAIDLVGNNLRRAVSKGEEDIEARYNMSLAATIGMIARVNSGGGATHGMAYPLGSKYHLPHGQSIALLMAHVMEYNVDSNIPKFMRIAKAMGERTEGLSDKEAAERAVEAIKSLLKDIGIFEGLREVGVKKEDFQEFVEIVSQFSFRHIEVNPKKLTSEDMVKIYENAWENR
ncbi:MAG: iron-containing alcohol dehydrogenase [Desulfobacteraceae bacterium]|nr:iron-containing alcohol dehydrogenase [Desulfobacteraceae bacterium]